MVSTSVNCHDVSEAGWFRTALRVFKFWSVEVEPDIIGLAASVSACEKVWMFLTDGFDISKILLQEFLNHGEISHCSTHRLFHPDFAAPFDTGLDEACLCSQPNFRSYILVENMMSTYI